MAAWVDGRARARAARLPVGVAGGVREEREEEGGRGGGKRRGERGEVSSEKPAAGEL